MKKNEIHILVVDDDPSINEVLKSLIERAGFKVTTATTPQEASNVVRLKTFHLTIIDCMLPVINGVDLAKQLLSSSLKGVPVILMSGIFRDEQFADEALKKSGATEFITKPFDTPALVAKINTLLSPLLDYKGGSLESLLTKLELSSRESRKSLDYMENVVGFELILIFNILMQTNLSGYLNIIDASKKLYGFTLQSGKIVDVDSLKNVKDIAALIAKMGLVSPAESSNMLSTIDRRDPIGFLVKENLISPHMARFIKIDRIIEDYRKLVLSDNVNITFIENKEMSSSDIFIPKETFDFLNYEICSDRVHLDFLEHFFSDWMNHKLVVKDNFDKSPALKNINSNDEQLIAIFKDNNSLGNIIRTQPKEIVFKLAYFLITNRLAYFTEDRKDKGGVDPEKRLQVLFEKLNNKTPFEVFQYFGSQPNPSAAEVEKIYKEFARANHPDKLPKGSKKELLGLNNKVYSIVSEAYSVLVNPDRKLKLINTMKEKEAKAQIKSEEILEKAILQIEKSQYHEALDLLTEASSLHQSKTLWLYTLWVKSKINPQAVIAKMPEHRAELDDFDAGERANFLYHFVCGLLYSLEGKGAEAEKFFIRSLEFDKGFLSARRELALLRSRDKGKKRGTDFLTGDVTSIISGIFNKKRSG